MSNVRAERSARKRAEKVLLRAGWRKHGTHVRGGPCWGHPDVPGVPFGYTTAEAIALAENPPPPRAPRPPRGRTAEALRKLRGGAS